MQSADGRKQCVENISEILYGVQKTFTSSVSSDLNVNSFYR